MKKILTGTIIGLMITAITLSLITLNNQQIPETNDYTTSEQTISPDELDLIKDLINERLAPSNESEEQATLTEDELQSLIQLIDSFNNKTFAELTNLIKAIEELLSDKGLTDKTIKEITTNLKDGLNDLLNPVENNYTYTPVTFFSLNNTTTINNLITSELNLLESQNKISNIPYETINNLTNKLNNTEKSIENYNELFDKLTTELNNSLTINDPELTITKIINSIKIKIDITVMAEPSEIKSTDTEQLIKILNSLPYPELNLRNPGIREGYNTANFEQIQPLIPNKTGYLIEYQFFNNYYLLYMILDLSTLDELNGKEYLIKSDLNTKTNSDTYCNNCTNKISINNNTFNYYDCNNCINNKIITSLNEKEYHQFNTTSFTLNIIPYSEHIIGVYMTNTDTTINEIITQLTNSAIALINYLE